MNNRGQTLVLFLFILPVLLMVFIVFYQLGTIQLEKKQIEKTLEEVVRYGVDYWGRDTVKEDMIDMFQESFPEISKANIDIVVEENKVKMEVQKNYDIAFLKKEKVVLSCEGEKKDGKFQIVKE